MHCIVVHIVSNNWTLNLEVYLIVYLLFWMKSFSFTNRTSLTIASPFHRWGNCYEAHKGASKVNTLWPTWNG